MADLALGISKTATEALVKKIKTAIKEEAELLQIVQRDILFMKDEFEMMKSFLDAADGEHIKNKVVRTWVRQIYDLRYDVEDCVEFVLHLDTKRSKSAFLLRLLPSCKSGARAMLPLDEAVAEIKLLKARVEDASQRNMRYNLISDSGYKPVQHADPAGSTTRKLDILIESRDAAKENRGVPSYLTRLIVEQDYILQVTSVWGTKDADGVVSVIKETYDDPQVLKQFRCRAWVKLTHPFNHQEFMRNMLAQFCINSCEEGQEIMNIMDVLVQLEANQGVDLVKEYAEQVNKNRYLVVLEDLSSMADWHTVRTYLPDKMNGSRIIVSTKQLEIGSSCIGHPYQVLELRLFSTGDPICIFSRECPQLEQQNSRGSNSLLPEASYVEDEFRIIVGRDSDLDSLYRVFHNPLLWEPRVVSVWGMAGAGKTALVRQVYDVLRSRWRDTVLYSWVDVSDPFSLVGFCQSLLSKSSVREEQHTVTDPIEECLQLLYRSQCLLVIDGLQSKEDWDLINSEVIQRGSRACIFVITTEEAVARHAMSPFGDYIWNVAPLQDYSSLELFRQELYYQNTWIFINGDSIEEEKFLLSKCGGIPKKIVALVSNLSRLHNQLRSRGEWVLNSVGTGLENGCFLHDLLAVMRASFDTSPHVIKKCVFYLSIFPQNIVIRRRRLGRRWIAEGYTRDTDNSSLEEDAEKNMDRLSGMGVMGANMTTAAGQVINPFVLQYIISWETDKSIFLPLEVSVLEGRCNGTTGRVGQHLAIWSSWERDEFVFQSLDLSRLRSLTVFGEWQPFLISSMMRVLRVLDLEGTSNLKDADLEKILELLPRLKFLSLRGCAEIRYLPGSLGGLRQLQTLDIRGTSVVKLPRSITKLQKLQYIRGGSGTATPLTAGSDGMAPGQPSTSLALTALYTRVSFWSKTPSSGPISAYNGVKVPRGIRRLKALHTLGAIKLSTAGGGAMLNELNQLKQLKKLEVAGIKRENSPVLFSVLSQLTNLMSLSLWLEKDNHVSVDCICNQVNLRSLKLRGHVEMLPQGIPSLCNLVKLSLEMTTLFTNQNIHDIGSLVKLHTLHLRVKRVEDDEISFSSDYYFREMKVLEIACGSSLHLSFVAGGIYKLEWLKVHSCHGSVMQISGLGKNGSLKHVSLKGCYDDIEGLQQELSFHPNKPDLKIE